MEPIVVETAPFNPPLQQQVQPQIQPQVQVVQETQMMQPQMPMMQPQMQPQMPMMQPQMPFIQVQTTQNDEEEEEDEEDEQEIPAGLIQVFRMINKLKSACCCYIVLFCITLAGIPAIVPYIIGCCFTSDLDICVLHCFYGWMMIEYICGIIGVISVVIIYVGGGFIAGSQSMIMLGVGVALGSWLFLELFIGIPYRMSRTIKEGVRHYGNIPYNQIRSWYYQDNWGSSTSNRKVRKTIAESG